MDNKKTLSQKQKISLNEKAIKREMKKFQKYLHRIYSNDTAMSAESIMFDVDQYFFEKNTANEKTMKSEMNKLQKHLHSIYSMNPKMSAIPIISMLDRYILEFTLVQPTPIIQMSDRFKERLTRWAQL